MDFNTLKRNSLPKDDELSKRELTIKKIEDSFKISAIEEVNEFSKKLYEIDLSTVQVSILMEQDISNLHKLIDECKKLKTSDPELQLKDFIDKIR